jgi:hydroxypyruvate reductase
MLENLIRSALASAEPGACLAWAWPTDLDGPVYLVAIGKASLGLAAAAAERLGERLVRGVVTAVPERLAAGRPVDLRLAVVLADHPLPTDRNIVAAREVLEFVRRVPKQATLMVLLSGGGSAHLTLPAGAITLSDLRAVTGGLQRAGATIAEINTVRKHCEQIKGGRLAAACSARRIVTLAMSDVEGDAADVIASGPTVGDPSTFADALAVLDRHDVEVPTVREHLRERMAGEHDDTPKLGDVRLSRGSWKVIANNRTVLDAAADAARRLGLFVVREHCFVSGDAAESGRRFAASLRDLARSPCGTCLLAGGEPVVKVGSGSGSGGPSQEFALAAAAEIAGLDRVAMAAVSTDGADGPPGGGNDHAGAIVDGTTVARGLARGLDSQGFLARHDSAAYFRALGDSIRTGPTGTNLNHIFIGVAGDGGGDVG